MGLATAYGEASAADRDVVAFVAAHPLGATVLRLGLKKAWVARQAGAIVGVLVLRTTPFVALNYLAADPAARTFMRLFKLWRMAAAWLVQHAVPLICVEVHDTQLHFSSLLRRLGFVQMATSEEVGSAVYVLKIAAKEAA